MKTAGIIAEYNPFHNGHQYQMETVRHLTGADFVIVAMSGDFLPVSYTHLTLPTKA